MEVMQRHFCGEQDLRAMADLARACTGHCLHVVDLPYRFSSWALDDPDNVSLWVDAGGRLLAWAVMQAPFWAIDHACRPDAVAHLFPQILAWADDRARRLAGTAPGGPMWFVNVFAGQTTHIRVLEEAGFACQAGVGEDSWSRVLMRRPGAPPDEKPVLPAGFALRPLAGQEEVEAYVDLHRTAFESRNMTVEWRSHTLRRPEYGPDLDLVAVDPQGRLAAFCICWLDRAGAGPAIGQVEPLGVRPDCRGLGLGQAILSEGLRRLHLCGADPIWVETDNHRNAALELYGSVGFQVALDVLVFRRDHTGA